MYETISFASPVLLGLLGLIITFWAPTTRSRKLVWVAIFLIVAVMGAVASTVQSRSNDRQIAEMITGGENYGYLWAEVDAAEDDADAVPLWFQATGLLYNVKFWIAPADVVNPNDDRYWSLFGGDIGETTGGFRIGKSLPAGKYRIEFSARNGSFFQMLEIKPSNGKLVQNIEVFRHPDGRIFSKGPDVGN